MRHKSTGSDRRASADPHSGKYDRAGAKPHLISDRDRPRMGVVRRRRCIWCRYYAIRRAQRVGHREQLHHPGPMSTLLTRILAPEPSVLSMARALGD